MLLYAGGHLQFVIDAYTKRIFLRHGWCREDASYDELQQLCQRSLSNLHSPTARLDYWKDYHAQLVRVGKEFCRPREPRCAQCPLSSFMGASSVATRRGQAAGSGQSAFSVPRGRSGRRWSFPPCP
jgi:endonuclease-3 related protein